MDEEIKEWLIHFHKDIVHEVHIIAEDIIGQFEIVAEGMADLSEKLDSRTEELKINLDNFQAILEGKYN